MSIPGKQKIAVLVSGGVDSSAALALLKNAGHDVHAFYLKIWLEDEMSFLGECPWEDDLQYVRRVCEQFKVPLEMIPLQREYWERVVSYVIHEVHSGRTPNPDVLCNAQVKFGAFYEAIRSRRFEKIATGHYARSGIFRGKAKLLRAVDPIKDQTYFLSQLSQEQVSRAIFPIGGYLKGDVRRLAREYGLPNAERKDSQGICFLGKISFPDFLRQTVGTRNGDIVEYETKRKVGEHDGFWFFTIGQRKGIKLSGGPWFVVSKDASSNTVFVSNAWRASENARNEFAIEGIKWIAGSEPKTRVFSVKIRHGEHEYVSRIRKRAGECWKVTLDHSDAGIAPGQFAVFYDGEECLGGGVIH